eukprot:m.1447794 g.1447794  ORF g.1447794 m.1447794 type:complete len:1137 (+) comp25110_c0_seq12:126-3536(+)
MGDSKVRVAVRVRPFAEREKQYEGECVLDMRDNQTIVKGKFTKDGADKPFTFDHSIWSHDKDDAHFQTQATVFKSLGTDVLENAFLGYNACIFAYGQTGSGKTYTMMGAPNDDGIIPRLCESLFETCASKKTADIKHTVEVSYMEIYNEKVQDLLAVNSGGHSLKVREHKVLGPYVQGLSRLAVSSFADVNVLMTKGNKIRTTAKTAMNDTSSRSHAVFTLFVTEHWYDKATKSTGAKASRVSLVDLAGSERVVKTGATGARLKEGANINKSLTTLGLVIKALAEQSTGSKRSFVPYRDSVLTWLLKDNLGGNAKTVMVATVSPSINNLDETISTLRYADSAKQIVNRAVINEDPNARMIRELKEELETLRSQVGSGGGGSAQSSEELVALKAQLAETEQLMQGISKSWEDKLRDSQQVVEEHKQLLDQHGASVTGTTGALRLESNLPHLVTVSTGLDFGINIFTLKEGMTRFGLADCEDEPQDVELEGSGIDPEHCIAEHVIEMDDTLQQLAEVVYLHPIGDCYVNTTLVEDSVKLKQGDVVQLGEDILLRFNHPTAALRMKQLGLELPLQPAVLHSAAQRRQLEERSKARQLAADRQREQAEALKESQKNEEARAMAELREVLEQETRKREEWEELHRIQREAEMAEQERLLQEQRDDLERQRLNADEIRRAAEEAQREVELERERAAAQRAEAAEIARQRDEELEKNRKEQEEIRMHHMRLASIDEARRKAESRKAELEARHAADASRKASGGGGMESNPFHSAAALSTSEKLVHQQAKFAHRNKGSPVLIRREPAPAARAGSDSSATVAREKVASEKLAHQREMFNQRQSLPEVKNAGKKDDTDRRIRAFEDAKKMYLQKKSTRKSSSPHEGSSPSAQSGQPPPPPGKWNPFTGTRDAGDNGENYAHVQPDEVVPDTVDLTHYIQQREQKKELDMATKAQSFQGDRPEWLMHQWDLLSEQDWFEGFCTREEAQEILADRINGSFVVRASESYHGHYAISVVQRTDERAVCHHLLIFPSYAGGDPTVPGGTRYRLGKEQRNMFNTVPKLIAYYIANPYHHHYRLRGHVKQERQAGGFNARVQQPRTTSAPRGSMRTKGTQRGLGGFRAPGSSVEGAPLHRRRDPGIYGAIEDE